VALSTWLVSKLSFSRLCESPVVGRACAARRDVCRFISLRASSGAGPVKTVGRHGERGGR